MPKDTDRKAAVIGYAIMKESGEVVLELDFDNRPTGPKGKSRMVFMPSDAGYWEVMAHLPHLSRGETQVVRDDWQT